jgi:hypothetical protein
VSETVRTYREIGIFAVCPTCGAPPRRSCTATDGGELHGLHDERHRLAVELGAPRTLPFVRRHALSLRSMDALAALSAPADGRTDGRPAGV